MQVASLIHQVHDDPPLDEPKVQIRFAPYISSANNPTTEELSLFLNRTDKYIFMMMAKPYFSIKAKSYDIPRKEFAVLLWKVSLLRRVTNKGRKVENNKGQQLYDETLSKSNVANRDPSQFLMLTNENKELRCLKVWKNLRKYFTFTETDRGWNMHHSSFSRVDDLFVLNSLTREIAPIRQTNKQKRRTIRGKLDDAKTPKNVDNTTNPNQYDPLMALATEASKQTTVITNKFYL